MTNKKVMLYKLTDAKGQTRNGMQWGKNVTHKAKGDASQDLCSDGWIHAYTHPALAVIFNPIHADFAKPQLWEAKGIVGKEDGLKVGCRKLTTLRQIALPRISTKTEVAFGILCALEVEKDPKFVQWANDWISGKDRTQEAAWATQVTWAAAWATWAAARAARAAAAPRVTEAVAEAAAMTAAMNAARGAARAAEATEEEVIKHKIDFPSIYEKACEVK